MKRILMLLAVSVGVAVLAGCGTGTSANPSVLDKIKSSIGGGSPTLPRLPVPVTLDSDYGTVTFLPDGTTTGSLVLPPIHLNARSGKRYLGPVPEK